MHHFGFCRAMRGRFFPAGAILLILFGGRAFGDGYRRAISIFRRDEHEPARDAARAFILMPEDELERPSMHEHQSEGLSGATLID